MLSCLCDNACKRSLVISRKNRASCPITGFCLTQYIPHALNRGINIIKNQMIPKTFKMVTLLNAPLLSTQIPHPHHTHTHAHARTHARAHARLLACLQLSIMAYCTSRCRDGAWYRCTVQHNCGKSGKLAICTYATYLCNHL